MQGCSGLVDSEFFRYSARVEEKVLQAKARRLGSAVQELKP